MSSPDEELSIFIRNLDQAALSDLLIELAATNDPVRERLQRLRLSSEPRRLAAAFRTRLSAWRRSTRFIGYRDSRAFAGELESWLRQVEREILPAAPLLALELFEAFIGSDANFFERADDSGGCIGQAIGTACTLWLRAAARCDDPPGGWTGRIGRIYLADEYGAREQLLRSANLLLAEPQLRELVASFESDLADRVRQGKRAGSLPTGAFRVSGALHLLAEALRDPDVQVRAVLLYSPEPNALQRAEFVKAYLACDRPSDALKWLDGHWDHHENTRLRLLADTYSRLGRDDESTDIRRQLFEVNANLEDFCAWRDSLPSESRAAAEARARQRAQEHTDPLTAARLLLEIGDIDAAESILLAKAEVLDGRDYPRLLPLAEAMEAQSRTVAATACYRALLLGILGRSYAPAYPHAVRYLVKVRELSLAAQDPRQLQSHAAFEAAIKSAHGRKVSFWKQVGQS